MAKPKATIPQRVNTQLLPEVDKSVNILLQDTYSHIKNNDIHVDDNLRENISFIRKDVDSHINNDDIHVTLKEKDTWNAKETTQGAQSKANKVMASLKAHTSDSTVHLTKSEKDSFKDKYTKAETRNLLKHALTGLEFLESVSTVTDLHTKYPKPEINSCCYVRSAKTTFVYNGTKWVDFNGLFTPEVTNEFDGLMSKDDKIKLDEIEVGANNYIHPDNVDVRHVSDAQIDYWTKKADNTLASYVGDGLMSMEDKIKLDEIDSNANNYIHPEKHDPSIIEQDENNRFVTDLEKQFWNDKAETVYVDAVADKMLATAKSFADSKIASIFNSAESQLEILRTLAFEFKKDDTVKQFFDLFNNCIKSEDFKEHILNDKLHLNRADAGLLENVKSLLEKELNPDWNETDSTSKSFIKNKPKYLPANGGNADTVGGYKPETLLNNRSFYDYVIGTPNYKEDQVSVIAEENTVIELFNLFRDGLSILFKPGSYSVEKELVIKASNTTISGIGNISKLLGASIKIVGNNNTIENISFVNGKDSIVNVPAIIVEGDNNIIRYNTITNYSKGILVEGSNNTIIYNTLINIRHEAIRLSAEVNSNYGNTVERNGIRFSNLGIVLSSSNNSLTKNHIIKNNVLNCNSGIILSNSMNNSNKTTMNIINENIVMRGNGDISDYSSSQHTIISEFSSKNMISNNITSGKQINARKDVLSNNIF